ncbi:MAG: NUDIX domain-containing protein, partial [Rhodomicrobiaceae bacterium]
IHGAAPFAANWRRLAGRVSHTFTHFHLELEVYLAAALDARPAPDGCAWYAAADLPREALPSVMRKVLAHAAEPRPRKAAG